MLAADLPTHPLWYPATLVGWSDKVTNVKVNAFGVLDYAPSPSSSQHAEVATRLEGGRPAGQPGGPTPEPRAQRTVTSSARHRSPRVPPTEGDGAWARYVIRRLLQMIPVILGTTFLIYAHGLRPRATPPSAAAASGRARRPTSRPSTPSTTWTSPCCVQYALYMGKVLQGDLGTNFYGNEVADELSPRFPTTIKLALIALVFEIVIGITAGILAGIRTGGFIDNLVLVSHPGRHLHPGLRARLRWPSCLRCQARLVPGDRHPGHRSVQLILPGFVLASLSMAYVARLTRTPWRRTCAPTTCAPPGPRA